MTEPEYERRHVALASSSKYYDRVRAMVATLESRGVTCYAPSFAHDETKVIVRADEKHALTRRFLRCIQLSDALYVVDIDGYAGISVAIEVGYAAALGKRVYAIEPPKEEAIAALLTEVVGLDELLDRIGRHPPNSALAHDE